MLWPRIKSLLTGGDRTMRLSNVLLVPLGAFLLVSACLVFLLTYTSGRQSAIKVTDRLCKQVADNVSQSVTDFVKAPEESAELNRTWMQKGVIHSDDPNELMGLFLGQIRIHPNLTFVSFGSVQGWYIGANRNPDTGEVLVARCQGPGQAFETYHLDAQDHLGALTSSIANYDPRKRGWFLTGQAISRTEPARWYPVYIHITQKTLGVGVAVPIRGQDDRLLGVQTFDVALNEITRFLKEIPVGKTGISAVIERNGQLIATSFMNPGIQKPDGTFQRYSVQDANHPLLSAAWKTWLTSGANTGDERGSLETKVHNQSVFIEWTRLRRAGTLDLVVLTVLPTADFIGDFDRAAIRTFLSILLVALISTILVFLITQRIVRPIHQLELQAAAIEADQTACITLDSPIREIHGLSRALSRMTTMVAERSEQLLRSNRQLLLAKDAAEDANRAKSSFLANMSHELRTPLNAILLYTELLSDEVRERGMDPYLQDLSRIQSAGKHLLSLIDDILDISNIEAGRMTVHLENCDIPMMFTEITTAIDFLISRNNNRLVVNVDPVIQTLYSDQKKLRQTLYNILNNAAKFTEGGTITLSVGPDPDNQAFVRFTVSDTGIGMSPDQVSRIFQEFTQADETTTRKFAGIGLGLALCRRLMDLLGGSIRVESTFGKGSTFTITLPSKNGSSG